MTETCNGKRKELEEDHVSLEDYDRDTLEKCLEEMQEAAKGPTAEANNPIRRV